MNMKRKILRQRSRSIAERYEMHKPSKVVHSDWEAYQIAKNGGGKKGEGIRIRNMIRGTRPKKNWRTRIAVCYGEDIC